jgi:octaheme c-type cytochrome (tetrathionate reductase family)
MMMTKRFAMAAALAFGLAACSGEEKSCTDFCGTGSACVADRCVAVLSCEPACGTGEACQDGSCVATLESACTGGCITGQVCVTSAGEAACVDVCGANQRWNATTQECELQVSMDHTRYFGGFSDTELANGPAVTAQCLNCHSIDATQMVGAAHFKWLGPSPGLAGHETDTAAVGKKNLINNFCIAVASNEARCTQCHAGYGDATSRTPGYAFTGDAALGRVDCLICHADMTTGYAKSAPSWGAADVVSTASGCSPACTTTEVCVDGGTGPACVAKSVQLPKALKAAAKSVGRPGRANCGFCHFGAGGGDNVKMGDLASSLTAPAMQADAHMGTIASGGQGMVCVDCHASFEHEIFGAGGVSVAVSEGRTLCTTCHDTAAAAFTAITTHRASHLAAMACQTCHIPAFSRQLPTKMSWDWSTAGHRSDPLWPAASATFTSASGVVSSRATYDWQKGNFVWAVDVAPAYRWYDGKGTHLTIADAFTQAGDAANPILIAGPTATASTAGAKISPFKLMGGRQAAMVSKAFLIVPHLFGTDGFWDTTTPKLPTAATDEQILAAWNDVLADGALKAGQPSGLSAEVDFAPTDWFWAQTRMYMNINHEVAPKTQAIGAAGCGDCHGAAPRIPFCEIYGGTVPAGMFGVTCP